MSNDLIDKAIRLCIKKGKRLEVVHRYIRMKYRIYLDQKILKRRMMNVKDLEVAH